MKIIRIFKEKIKNDPLIIHILSVRQYHHKKQLERNNLERRFSNFHPISFLKKYVTSSVKIFIAASLTVFLFWIFTTFSIGYTVYVDNNPLFVTDGLSYVNKSVSEIENLLHKNLNTPISLTSRVNYKKGIIKNVNKVFYPNMRNILNEALDKNYTASAIVVNGTPVVYVADEKTANKILEKIKKDGSAIKDNETLMTVAIDEEISIRECVVNVSELTSFDKAVNYLKTGDQTPITYTLKLGDTLWTVARAYHVSVDAIANLNNIDKNQILLPGDEITLTQDHPIISVVATVSHQDTETIPFDTIIEENPEKVGIEVKQEGHDGERVVDYIDTNVNGVIMAQKITAENITIPVENRVIVRGTKVILGSLGYINGDSPLLYPAQGFISQYYGDNGGHTGVDIANNLGTPIVAAAGGTVIYTQHSNVSYGNYIVIQHANNVITRYAHCEKIMVNVGDYVTPGQLIATMGSTGNSTGPHLHFEVLINGNFVNPFGYI